MTDDTLLFSFAGHLFCLNTDISRGYDFKFAVIFSLFGNIEISLCILK